MLSVHAYTARRMDVVVFGKHVEIPPQLRALTLEKLERLGKFAGDVRRIDVDFAEHATRRPTDSHSCEILVHLNKHLVKAQASAAEHQIALDVALDKVEQQMRKVHERRVHRRNGKDARGNGSAAETPDEGDSGTTIVKTKQFAVKPMNAEEAVLQMELLGHDFFVFTSAESGRAAVLYRRRDGNLGLIETSG
jgi:putative sigma-54 modulation protein